jgi:hypothetical protein
MYGSRKEMERRLKLRREALDEIYAEANPTLRNRIICWWFGHRWVDLDPCDPEVGPNPEIVCRRCGSGPSINEV